MADLGYIGLGTMGSRMAAHLIKAGHRVTVWNRTPGPEQALVALGAQAAAGPAGVAAAADIIFTNVSTGDVVDALVTETLAAARPGALFVDHSTIGVADCRRIWERCRAAGAGFLDAPVSGGPWGAEGGTLAIMVGGEAADFDRALPYLELMGKNIRRLGPAGAGAVAKLCNQMLVAAHTAAMAEAWVLATKAGVDPADLLGVVSTATGNSAQIQRNLPKFVFPGNFAPAFSLAFLHKDVALANTLARELQVPVNISAAAEQMLIAARAQGLSQQDYSSLIRPLEQTVGVEVRSDQGSKS